MLAPIGLSKSDFNSTLPLRFKRKCGKSIDNGCIPWNGYKTKTEYGIIRLSGGGSKKTTAHRVAWVLINGDISPEILVLHKCDNPSCVNVDHLFIESAKDNTEDMVNKERHSWRYKLPWQKLDSSHKQLVSNLREQGLSQQSVADFLGVSRPLISLIENGKIKYSATTPDGV